MPRIDIELVNRNLIETRAKAQDAIKNGLIYCNDTQIKKCSFNVSETDVIEIKGELLKYVSRGGLKLEKALNEFSINLTGKVMCDIGSSTGGFSDCAIQNGIKEIFAVDVGNNQFDTRLRELQNIHLYENTDFRNMDSNILRFVDIVTIDVSFISLKLVLPVVKQLLTENGEVLCLIKPQFEAGRENSFVYRNMTKSVRRTRFKKSEGRSRKTLVFQRRLPPFFIKVLRTFSSYSVPHTHSPSRRVPGLVLLLMTAAKE